MTERQKTNEAHDSMMQNIESEDFFTFIAMDSDSKLVPCYRLGKQTGRMSDSFMAELARRVTSRFQLLTDSVQAIRERR